MMVSYEFIATVMKMGARDCRIRIPVELAYDAQDDPFAIRMIFTEPDGEEVIWLASRDHFVTGSRDQTPVGEGDIKFRYDFQLDGVVVCLTSYEPVDNRGFHADILFPSDDVAEFLEGAVPDFKLGEQRTASLVDALIEELLG